MAGLPMLLFGALLELCSGVSVNRGGYPTFTDEIPFKITWPGAEFKLVSRLLGETVLCVVWRGVREVFLVFSFSPALHRSELISSSSDRPYTEV